MAVMAPTDVRRACACAFRPASDMIRGLAGVRPVNHAVKTFCSCVFVLVHCLCMMNETHINSNTGGSSRLTLTKECVIMRLLRAVCDYLTYSNTNI